MEKYARQAIAEGVKTAEEIKVSTESELYRVLNLHYNRNNQIEVRSVTFSSCWLRLALLNDFTFSLQVPEHFRSVIEATLREFYKSLVAGKDQEQSWKKPIYKVIARMDQSVPDFFKSTNWMEQLADNWTLTAAWRDSLSGRWRPTFPPNSMMIQRASTAFFDSAAKNTLDPVTQPSLQSSPPHIVHRLFTFLLFATKWNGQTYGHVARWVLRDTCVVGVSPAL